MFKDTNLHSSCSVHPFSTTYPGCGGSSLIRREAFQVQPGDAIIHLWLSSCLPFLTPNQLQYGWSRWPSLPEPGSPYMFLPVKMEFSLPLLQSACLLGLLNCQGVLQYCRVFPSHYKESWGDCYCDLVLYKSLWNELNWTEYWICRHRTCLCESQSCMKCVYMCTSLISALAASHKLMST